MPDSAKGAVYGWRFFAKLAGAAVGILLLIALCLPAQRGAREPARRVQCVNNLKQIQLAIQSYQKTNHSLPPAYTVDADGNRLHSWRSLILPFMEHDWVYKKIDFSLPWDHPANAAARSAIIDTYQCPSVVLSDDQQTTYLAIVGPKFLFRSEEPRQPNETAEYLSRPMVVDVPGKHAVHWMSPEDISPERLSSMCSQPEANHPGIIQSISLNDSVEALSHAEMVELLTKIRSRKNAPEQEQLNAE